MVVGESPVSINSLAGLPSSLNDQITFSETLKIFNGRGKNNLKNVSRSCTPVFIKCFVL